MSETKDPAIKLFGRTIPLPGSLIPAKPRAQSDVGFSISDKSEVVDVCTETTRTGFVNLHSGESRKLGNSVSDGKVENQQSAEDANETRVKPNPTEDSSESNSSIDQDKVLKRPDKIIPCPRCNSLETKFCYFNNYNVNQPRHFCRNCHRYWTAGGSMRNVPIGAGRRKNKHLASQFRQILMPPDGIPVAGIKIPEAANQQLVSNGESPAHFGTSTGNGASLNFGPDGPLCKSMTNVLQLRDQKRNCESGSVQENREDTSLRSSSMAASRVPEIDVPEKERANLRGSCNERSSPRSLQCYPVPPWVFTPMVPTHTSSDPVPVPNSSGSSPIQWCSTPMLAVPGFCPPNIPLQLVPASYFSCVPLWTAKTNNSQLVGSNSGLSSSSSSSSTSTNCSGNNSPTLGKHSRDLNMTGEEKSKKGIFAPKTLRVDDKDAAVLKSSIWTSLGSKSNQKERPFKSNSEDGNRLSDSTEVLEANPAAHSRFQTFQEST